MRRTAVAIVSTHPSASQNDSTTSVPVLITILLAEVENISLGGWIPDSTYQHHRNKNKRTLSILNENGV